MASARPVDTAEGHENWFPGRAGRLALCCLAMRVKSFLYKVTCAQCRMWTSSEDKCPPLIYQALLRGGTMDNNCTVVSHRTLCVTIKQVNTKCGPGKIRQCLGVIC